MDPNQIHQANTQQAVQQALSGSDAPKEDKDDKLIDPKEVKEDLERSLLGRSTKWVERDNGELVEVEVQNEDRQLCNERGFSRIWATVEGVLNTNVAGGYMSQKELNRLGYSNMSDLALQMWSNHQAYGIQSIEDYRQIMSIVASNLKANLSKARGGRGLKHNEQTLSKRIVETITPGNNDQSKWGNLL